MITSIGFGFLMILGSAIRKPCARPFPWKRERIQGQDGSGYGREDIKMKEKQNKRWGLKLLSVLCAFLVWLGVVNVADPVMTSTVEVPVEIVNSDVLTKNNLTYEVVGKSTTTVQKRRPPCRMR